MTEEHYPFLSGGGEMGELIRNYDWSRNPLGTPDTWPQSLRTMVSMVLHARFPMFLWWGPDLIQFYNDAYRLSLGNNGKHPHILGKKGAESWDEIWQVIGPMAEGIMAGGPATWSENQLIPIYRNGRVEDVYWTFSYSPVMDESGQPGGVLVTCHETTGIVAQTTELRQNRQQLDNLFTQINAGIAQTDTTGHLVDVNDRYCQMLGYTREELLGMSLRDINHPDDDPSNVELFKKCVATGENFIIHKRYLRKDGQALWVSNSVSRVITPDGRTLITAVSIDIAASKEQERLLRESEERLRGVIAAAPAGIALFVGRDLIIENPNKTFIRILGKGPGVEGRPLREAMPELLTEGQPFLKILDDVFTTGVPFTSPASLVKIVQDGRLQDCYYNISYTPLYNAAGAIYAILDIAIDVTEQVKAEQALKKSEAHLELLRDSVPAMTFYMDSEQRYQSYNKVFMDWFNVGPTEVIGKTSRELIGEVAYSSAKPYLDRAYAGERVQYEMPAPSAIRSDRWLSIVYTPHITDDNHVEGIVVHATDISASKRAELALRQSEARFHNLVRDVNVGMIVLTEDEMRVAVVNEAYCRLIGHSVEETLNRPIFEVIPEVEAYFLPILQEVKATGRTISQSGVPYKVRGAAGETMEGFTDSLYQPYREADGTIVGVMAVVTDVTGQVRSRQQLEENEARLESAVELAQLANWSVDLKLNKPHYSERFRDWVGISEHDAEPDLLMFVAEEDRDRVAAAVHAAKQSGGTGLFDEIYSIVHSKTGQRRIIHTIGNVQFDAAGNAITMSGTAQDITLQRELQLALENEVHTRTEQLAAAIAELRGANEALALTNEQLTLSNEELAQYAYVASHDLQEPLRKIRVFSGMLIGKQGSIEQHKMIIEKISQSARRMSGLIQDLLAFSQLPKSEARLHPVALADVVSTVWVDFELAAQERNAVIEIGPLPQIEAVGLQMNQLFYNLISNSLKFTAPGVRPQITVECGVLPEEELQKYIAKPLPCDYHHIRFRDNGIGFDTKYSEQIFEVFKRLHGRDQYPGSGIGLSLCRRIVMTHQGYMYAESREGEGTTFHILLPACQQEAQ